MLSYAAVFVAVAMALVLGCAVGALCQAWLIADTFIDALALVIQKPSQAAFDKACKRMTSYQKGAEILADPKRQERVRKVVESATLDRYNPPALFFCQDCGGAYGVLVDYCGRCGGKVIPTGDDHV